MSVGTNDLSKAMEVAGAGMVTYGNDINDMISLVTAGTEIMVGRSQQVARGLNTIASRIAKNEDALKEYGIEIYNTDGSLRSTYDILKDLAPVWQTMGDAQRVALGDTLAGTNQYKVLASVMGNFDSALKAHEVALNSSGSASRENERAIDSLAGHLNQLKAQFEALANKLISSDFVKAIIDAGTAILKFANSDLGQAIIKIGALMVATKAFIAVGSTLMASKWNFTSWIAGMVGLQGATIGTTEAVGALTTALLANPLFWVAAGGLLIFTLAKIIETDAEKFERLNKEIDENNQKLSELQSEYDQLNSKAIEDLTESEKERLEVLESQLNTIKEQNKELQKQAYEVYKPKEVVVGREVDDALSGIGQGGDVKYKETKESVDDYIKSLKTLNGVETENKQILADHAKQLEDFKEAGIELNDADKDFLNTYTQLSTAYNAGTEAAQNYGNTLGGIVMQQMEQLTAAMQEQNETGSIAKQTYNNLLQVFPTLGKYVDTTTGKIKLNKNAVQDLVGATSEARNAALQFANGQGAMEIATNATTKEIRNQLVAMEAQAMAARSAYVSSRLATGDTLSEIEKSGSAELARLDTAFSKIHDALNRLDAGLLTITKTTNNDYTPAVTANTKATTSNTKATTSNTKAQEKQAAALKKANAEYETQKKKLDNLTESYENAADAYKITADYMVDKIDKEISSLQKRRDAVEESYDKQISKIQEANNEMERQIELEKAQQALAEAKSKQLLVYKDGKLQYQQDDAAIQEAQANLAEIQRQQAQEDKIKQLEAKRDKELATIDSNISYYEKYKEQWESLGSAYEDAQNKLIAQQILGIKLEGDNWKKRLKQADTYIKKYKTIMKRLGVLSSFTVDVDTGSVKSLQSGTKSIKNLLSNYKSKSPSLPSIPKGFAGGTTSTPTGIYKVGEFGEELMVGKGAGIISHNLTENLMKLGQFSPAQLIEAVGKYVDRGQTVVQQFGDISLPNVTNASQFVEQLKQFKNYAVQATSRR